MTAIVPVILAGGGGARLWPLSTPIRPKQFHALASNLTMLQETALRFVTESLNVTAPLVVTGAAFANEAGDQLTDIGIAPGLVIVEPIGRNTAPAVAAAACHLGAGDPDALMLVLPADQHVADAPALHDAIAQGIDAARSGALLTFGVVPANPATGYGYIERCRGEGPVYAAARFIEKPCTARASEMVADGRYYWNAGIFLFSPRAILKALAEHVPDVEKAAREAVAKGRLGDGMLHLAPASFGASPAISIDHGVMEKAGNVAVVPLDAGWSDVGSFAALRDIADLDAHGNARKGLVFTDETQDCYLRTDSGILASIGVSGLAVVRSGDAVLVAPLNRSQDVRRVADLVTTPLKAPEGHVSPVGFGGGAARLHEWLIGDAFPVWGERAWDTERGGFHETMTLDGNPNPDDRFKRLRVQARQIFVCCTAHELGLEGPYLDLAQRGFAFLRHRGWQEAGGWPHLFHPDGAIKDPMRDAYDHAFVLFAMAALYRTTGDISAINWARRTVAYLDAAMADDIHGGFVESAPPVTPRRANPHMHLLEAFLALYDATGDFAWLDRAQAMVRLFRDVFIDTETGTLREFFGPDWQPAQGFSGRLREPGHHWEWAFLLHEYGTRTRQDFCAEIDALTGFALSRGHDPKSGLAFEEVLEDGTVHSANVRLWPQTEALRGMEMLRQRGRDDLDARIDLLANAVTDRFLGPAPGRGMWVDRFDPDGNALSDSVPASSLYHLVTGILALTGK